MSFGGGGGGTSSIAGRTDVFLSAPTSGQVLTYDSSTLKWKNAAGGSVPSGGTAAQVLAKNSNTSGDVGWVSGAPLSNSTPTTVGAGSSAGTVNAVARSDHQHPVSLGFGYAVASGKYSSPLGLRGSGYNGGAYAGQVLMSSLPVYQSITVDQVVVYGNASGNSVTVGIFACDPQTLIPTTRTAISSAVTVNSTPGLKSFSLTASITLAPGMYWVGLLPLTNDMSLGQLQSGRYANPYMYDHGFDHGNRVYNYSNGGAGYGSMPSTLVGQNPNIYNDGFFWYQVRSV